MALALCAAQGPTAAAPLCRQALALGLDVSGSVDLREYRLQLDGLIAALMDGAVQAILLDQTQPPVSLMVFEWSGPTDQVVLVPWTAITGAQALTDVRQALAATERRVADPGTGLGVAMQVGAGFLDQQPQCLKHTLDISGDGKSNLGPRPRDLRDAIGARGITINALVIGPDAPSVGNRESANSLSSYFRAEVITGPDAFAQTADGFDQYGETMTAKLKRELSNLALSQAAPGQRIKTDQ